jgi:hypothetical protein
VTDDTDDLATALFELDTHGLPTGATTTAITRAVARWASSRGWQARTEARVGLEADRATVPKLGYIDVVVRRGGGMPDMAIEIDSEDKRWSLDKLRHAAAAGMHAIWIRWGDDEWAGAFEGVDVIQLQVRRKARRRSPAEQLSLSL